MWPVAFVARRQSRPPTEFPTSGLACSTPAARKSRGMSGARPEDEWPADFECLPVRPNPPRGDKPPSRRLGRSGSQPPPPARETCAPKPTIGVLPFARGHRPPERVPRSRIAELAAAVQPHAALSSPQPAEIPRRSPKSPSPSNAVHTISSETAPVPTMRSTIGFVPKWLGRIPTDLVED